MPALHTLAVVIHICNACPWMAEAEKLEFKPFLMYTRIFLKKTKEKEKHNTFYNQVHYPKKAHGVITAVAKTRKIIWRERTWRVSEHRWRKGLAFDLGLLSLKTGDHEEANLQNWFPHCYWSSPWLSFQMATFKGILSDPCYLGPAFTFTISLGFFFFFCVGILKRALRLLLESMAPTCYPILLRVQFSTLKTENADQLPNMDKNL